MISINKLIGALVYRTKKALEKDKRFIANLNHYPFASEYFENGILNLHYFPGTHNEIINRLDLSNPQKGIKFPAILNLLPAKQNIVEWDQTVCFNLIIAGKTSEEWSTIERENKIFDPLLRPIYREFLNQIEKSNFFLSGFGNPLHECLEISTADGIESELIENYPDYLDSIELQELTLTLNKCYSDPIKQVIENEYNLIIDFIN